MSAPVSESGARARQVAIEALVRIERDDAYANLALDALLSRSGLDRRDRALVTALVYGTIRRRRSCEHLVGRFLRETPPAPAHTALLVGAYQLHFTDIPAHAAVSATVAATPKRLRGLVNAVLRKVASAPVDWPDLATRLSYPTWVVDQLTADLGQGHAIDALAAMNAAPELHERGDGYIQDLGSQAVVEAVPIRTGDLVWDSCAAPGGKATGLAARGARVIAGDRRERRVGLVAANVAKLDQKDRVLPVVADALAPPLRPACCDVVLLDAPCSGLGVLHRRPDARWRVKPDDIGRLAELQRALLAASIPLLRPGGVLVYSVCTMTAAETMAHDEWMASTHPALEPLDPPGPPWQQWGRGALLLPQVLPSDGMAMFAWRIPSAS